MWIRFSIFFISSLILFMAFTSLFIAFFLEYVLPTPDNDTLIIVVTVVPFIIGGIAFGVAFVNPLLLMLSLIKKLSTGQYNLKQAIDKVYRRNGKLKIRYLLYKELVSHLKVLAGNLQKAEIERKKLEDAKTTWIAGVSHDLKTPLSYVTGYSALLLSKEHSWSEEESGRFLSQIYDKSVYIGELISDLNLSFVHGASEFPLTRETFDIVDFIRNLIVDIANTPSAEKYMLEFQTAENHLAISADKKLLHRAFQNLLANAIRHNPNGTNIIVGLIKERTEQVVIYISDNGIGMDGPSIETEERKGRGLSIVDNIITAHGGRFTIESTPAQGTKCMVSLRTLS